MNEIYFSYLPVPEIRVTTKDVVVNEGADTRLNCQVKNSRDSKFKLSMYWQKDNVTLQPANHPRMRIKPYRYLKIKKASKQDEGLYTCIVENGCGGKKAVYFQLYVQSKSLNLV